MSACASGGRIDATFFSVGGYAGVALLRKWDAFETESQSARLWAGADIVLADERASPSGDVLINNAISKRPRLTAQEP